MKIEEKPLLQMMRELSENHAKYEQGVGASEILDEAIEEIERLRSEQISIMKRVAAEAWRFAVAGTDDRRNEPPPREAPEHVLDSVIINVLVGEE